MTNVLVGKHRTNQVANDLMHVDQNLRIILGIKGNRLNAWINLTPLFGPVCADFVRPTDKTALKRFRPSHIGSHEGEGSTNVTPVESRIRCAQQLDFLGRLICHER